MKLSRNILRRIISEEIRRVITEEPIDRGPDGSWNPMGGTIDIIGTPPKNREEEVWLDVVTGTRADGTMDDDIGGMYWGTSTPTERNNFYQFLGNHVLEHFRTLSTGDQILASAKLMLRQITDKIKLQEDMLPYAEEILETVNDARKIARSELGSGGMAMPDFGIE